MRRVSGRALLFLLLLPLLAAAAPLRIEVDKTSVSQGDTVTFTIRAEGKDVEFPVVKSIDGFPILGSAQKTDISIVNGSVSKSFGKSYTFAPMRDVTIPPLEVTVDGKRYTTEPVNITVHKARASAANGGSGASFVLSLDRHEAKVGEALKLEVTVKYPKEKNYVEAQIQRPEFANFWIKQVGEKEVYDEGGYRVVKYHYLLFPQKAGDFTLGPLTAKLARRVRVQNPFGNDPFFDDDFFNSMFARLEYRNIASNRIDVHVEPLPAGVELYGDFDIEAEADKKEVQANRPVHLTIRVTGYGNIDDVKKFDPDIPDAVVYADEPKIEAHIENGRYGGTFSQRITIVADQNYTVPPFAIRYVDAATGKVVEKRTDPIRIIVTGGSSALTQKSGPKPAAAGETAGKTESPGKETRPQNPEGAAGWIYLLVGFAAGVGVMLLWSRYGGSMGKSGEKRVAVSQKIRKAKSDRELFELILPYAKKSKLVESEVRKLEENLFEKKNNKIDRNELAFEIEELEGER
ncbi:BatD family protein [Hydrogenimonas sp.]